MNLQDLINAQLEMAASGRAIVGIHHHTGRVVVTKEVE